MTKIGSGRPNPTLLIVTDWPPTVAVNWDLSGSEFRSMFSANLIPMLLKEELTVVGSCRGAPASRLGQQQREAQRDQAGVAARLHADVPPERAPER